VKTMSESSISPINVNLTTLKDRSTTTVDVLALGGNRYRIVDPVVGLWSPEIRFQDVIEATPGSNDDLVFKRVIECAGYRLFDFCLPPEWNEHPGIRAILTNVEENGGTWEAVMGGILLIWLPPESLLDPNVEIQRCF
jgi:hypothetical protein